MSLDLVFVAMLVLYIALIVGAIVITKRHQSTTTLNPEFLRKIGREMRLNQLRQAMAAQGLLNHNGHRPKHSLRVIAQTMGYLAPRSARTQAKIMGTLKEMGLCAHRCSNRKLVTFNNGHHNGQNGHHHGRTVNSIGMPWFRQMT